MTSSSRRRARRAAWWSGPGSTSTRSASPGIGPRKWAPVFDPDAPGAAHVVQELFIGLDACAALPGMLALVHNHAPDLIVRETTEFSSTIAAAHFKVPVVAVGPHLDAGDRHRRRACTRSPRPRSSSSARTASTRR